MALLQSYPDGATETPVSKAAESLTSLKARGLSAYAEVPEIPCPVQILCEILWRGLGGKSPTKDS